MLLIPLGNINHSHTIRLAMAKFPSVDLMLMPIKTLSGKTEKVHSHHGTNMIASIRTRNTQSLLWKFSHTSIFCPNINYSSVKMMFLKRCAGSSLSNISQAPYTNPSTYSRIKPNTQHNSRIDTAYPNTISMIGGTSSFLRCNKTSISGLTESQMRKTIKRQKL